MLLLGLSPAAFSQSPIYNQTIPSKELGGEAMLPPRYSLSGIQKDLNRDVLSSSYSHIPASFAKAIAIEDSYDTSPTTDVRLIVQFRSPALGSVSPGKGRQRIFNLSSALNVIHGEHSQFSTTIQSIDASYGSMLGGVSTSATQIRFEYTTALNGVALTTKRWIGEEIQKLPYVSRVSIDETVQAADDASNVVIGAPTVWATYDVHGEGIDIGIMDTGIDYLHPALGHAAFPNIKVVGGYDFVNNDADPMDDNGHGTHVAGICAGDYGTTLHGVAYKARLWAFKVLDAQGMGYYSWIIAGIEKAMNPYNDPSIPSPIKVLNFSLGTDVSFYPSNPSGDPLAQAVNNAVSSGIVCAVAAGNLGPYYAAIGSPGVARGAITVGATTNGDTIAGFSSRGPEKYTWGLGTGFKPDVVAPGVNIKSAKLGGGYISYSGTSMATPQVTGAAALLLQLHPDWTPGRIKAVLMETARDIGQDTWTEGGGRISISDAAARKIFVEPSSIHFGMIDVSHPVAESIVTITLTNLDTTSQTISLSATVPPWTGTNSVSMTFHPAQVTLSPGGTASVSVALAVNYHDATHDLNSVTDPLYYTAKIIATTSSNPPTTIAVPYCFVYSMGFRIIAEETPWWLIDHAIWDFNWPVLNDTMYFWFPGAWPPDPDLMAGTFFDRKTKILKQIPQEPNQTVYLRKGDSKNKITVRSLDENGQAISLIPSAWAQLVRKKNSTLKGWFTLGCGRFLNCPRDTFWHPEELDLPDLDSSWVVSLAYQIYPHNGNLYVIPFTIDGPITTSLTLQNDTAKFKRVNYRFDSDNVQNEVVNVRSYDGGQTIGGYGFVPTALDVGISRPYTLTAYYLSPPTPNHTWGNYSLDVTYSGSSNPRISTAGMNIIPPDTAKFPSYLTTANTISWKLGIGVPSFSTTANPLSVKLGFAVPQWTGKTDNASTTVKLGSPSYAYFVHPLWYYPRLAGYLGEPTNYTLSSGSSVVASGVIDAPDDVPGSARSYSVGVNPGSYRLQLFSSHYRIGDTSGHSTASLEFDTRRSDPNSPYMTKIQILTNGNISDEYHRDTTRITFEVGDDVGVDSAMVYFQPLGGATWSQGTLIQQGSGYSVGEIPDLPGGYISMRLRIVDNSLNAFDYKMEPAFRFYAARPKYPPDLVSPVNGDTDQPAVMTLKWNESFTAKSYHFQLGTDSSLTNLLVDDPLLSQTLRRVYPLGKGVTYYWRVSAQNPAGASPFSKVCSFTTTTDTTFFMTTSKSRWNLISLPMKVKDRSRTKAFLTSASNAFAFENGAYTIADSLEYGLGYWLQFSPNDTFGVVGKGSITSDTITVRSGWNMIGSVSTPVPVSATMSEPAGMVTSNFFGYKDSYATTDTVRPGKAYWVKVSEDGQLILSAQSPLAGKLALNADAIRMVQSIKIIATSELPPPPPESEISTPRPAIAREFFLGQNYPNPFNPTTSIEYTLPSNGSIHLAVYDVLGREVAVLGDGYETAGRHSLNFNASSLASGIYFYRIEAGKFIDVKKMILMR